MKLLCDVCVGDVAAVFCCENEVALCTACDNRIHRPNELAVKHAHFSLLQPTVAAAVTATPHPLCDVCKERRGFVFCKEDRAILCSDCDSLIHSANQLTMKHNRFVLTDIHLSNAVTAAPEFDAAPISGYAGDSDEGKQIKTPALVDPVITSAVTATTGCEGGDVSEYLIKMLQGYCVEDLLVEQTMEACGGGVFCEGEYASLLPTEESNLEVCRAAAAAAAAEAAEEAEAAEAAEGFPIWVPHVPQFPPTAVHPAAREAYHVIDATMVKPGQAWWNEEDLFAVPQVPQAAMRDGNKRQRDSGCHYF